MNSSQNTLIRRTSRPVFFSVCIITFRRPALLKQCLELIAPGQQTLDPLLYEVLVSDDCPDGSAREVVHQTAFAHWIQGPALGVAANRNCVAKAASGVWIVYIDDDELPEPDWLQQLYIVASSGDWDVIEGRVEPADYPDSIFWYAPRVPYGGCFVLANLAILREVLFELGGFDERFRVSHEDMELGMRIQKAGLRTVFVSEALVWHPARQMTLVQVWRRLIQQQCQTFELFHQRDVLTGLQGLLYLLIWTAKYWFRVLRIEWALKPDFHWRRQVQANVLRALACPVASLRLWSTRDPRTMLG
jgi:cellulose synthase/poly-beta-1,6-N-acetylglucosamine synthase-like glycosyltransferase